MSSQAPVGEDTLLREFTLRNTFSLAFAFISPIIALYAIFALALGASGPTMWFAFPVVLLGQLMVALCFGELSGRWPLAGGLYQWGRILRGPTYGWISGWAYIWTLIALAIATAYTAAPFLATALGMDEPSNAMRLILALVFLAVATGANVIGRKPLAIFVAVSIACELIGSVVIGTLLLLFHRENGLGDLTSGFAGGGTGFSGFLVAVALVGWAFIGFESASDVAEEVENPRVNVPKALVFSLVLVACIVMYTGLALILAIPDLGAVASGNVLDPIAATLSHAFGDWIVTPAFLVVSTGFAAGLVAVQAAVSRVVFALSRDNVLPAASSLKRLSGAEHLPVNAILATAGISAVLLVVAVELKIYDTLIGLATVGFYISFLLPLVALLAHRVREGFEVSPDGAPVGIDLGRFGTAINALAVAWLTFEIVNIAWPRDLGLSWYVEWGCIISAAVIAVVGAATFVWLRSQGRIDAPGAADLEPQVSVDEPTPLAVEVA